MMAEASGSGKTYNDLRLELVGLHKAHNLISGKPDVTSFSELVSQVNQTYSEAEGILLQWLSSEETANRLKELYEGKAVFDDEMSTWIQQQQHHAESEPTTSIFVPVTVSRSLRSARTTCTSCTSNKSQSSTVNIAKAISKEQVS